MESLYGKGNIKVVPTMSEIRKIRQHSKLSERSKQDILELLGIWPNLANLILSMVEEADGIITETNDVDKKLKDSWERFKLENIFVYQHNDKDDMKNVFKKHGYVSIELPDEYCTGLLVSLEFYEKFTGKSVSLGKICYGVMNDNKEIKIVNHSCMVIP